MEPRKRHLDEEDSQRTPQVMRHIQSDFNKFIGKDTDTESVQG
jgi:hypothetical protein